MKFEGIKKYLKLTGVEITEDGELTLDESIFRFNQEALFKSFNSKNLEIETINGVIRLIETSGRFKNILVWATLADDKENIMNHEGALIMLKELMGLYEKEIADFKHLDIIVDNLRIANENGIADSEDDTTMYINGRGYNVRRESMYRAAKNDKTHYRFFTAASDEQYQIKAGTRNKNGRVQDFKTIIAIDYGHISKQNAITDAEDVIRFLRAIPKKVK